MGQLVLKMGKYLFYFITLITINTSCNEIESQIPDVLRPFPINLNIYNELQNPGSSVYFAGVGFGGVIVSCLSPGEYYAYDASCTHEVTQACHIEPEGLLGTCSCCESQFQLMYSAYPIEGLATTPLRQYNVSVLGGNTHRVYN